MRTHCQKGHPLTPDTSYILAGEVRCRECIKSNVQRWRKRNPEKVKTSKQRWYLENKGRVRQKQRHRDPGKAQEYNRRWRERHPAEARESRHKYEETHREGRRANSRRWYRNNPEKARESNRRRRARKKKALSNYAPWMERYYRCAQRDCCFYCGEEMNSERYHPRKRTLDHIIPFSKGGLHSWENTVLACFECNLRKHAKTVGEFSQSK